MPQLPVYGARGWGRTRDPRGVVSVDRLRDTAGPLEEATVTKISVLGLTLLLGGCATVGETMATKPPSLTASTTKTPVQFRDCMVQSASFAVWSITDIEGGYMLASTKVSGNVITVKAGAGGSDVTVWGLLGTRNAARVCI